MVSNEVLAAKHGCGKSTVTEILGKQRAKIVESFEQRQSDTKIRKTRPQKFEEMTSNMLSWCQAAFAANLEGLSDALLLEKSRSLAVEMGFENLDGLNLDWVQRFKKRHNIKTRKLDRCVGGKKSKNRITILLGANITGTEKLPVLQLESHRNRVVFGV